MEMIKVINFENFNNHTVIKKFLTLPVKSYLRLHDKLKPLVHLDDVEINRIEYFDKRIDKFWENVSRDHNIIIQRDMRYLNWRINDPTREYVIFLAEKNDDILGYIILTAKKTENFGSIVDILVYPGHEKVILGLISRACEWFNEKGKTTFILLVERGRKPICLKYL